MRKILLLNLFLGLSAYIYAGCPLVNVSLKDRINENEIVVEASVLAKFSYKNQSGDFIYTAHKLQVHSYFKGGLNLEYITLLTEGGVVGTEALGVNPNLETQVGESGLFFLTKNISWDAPDGEVLTFYSKTGPLGFVLFDRVNNKAFDALNQWGNIRTEFIPLIKSLTAQEIKISQPFEPTFRGRRVTPTITNFTPSTIAAGSGQVLTITGTGFGATRGTGFVYFPDANSGGSGYITPNQADYVSWTDTEIKVKVLTRAGTGKFKVFNSTGDNVTSATNLTIPWAHLNISYYDPGNGIPDTTAFGTQHIDENGNGGITWIWDSAFAVNAPAVSSFIRAIESWRCNTLINWDTAGTLNNDTMKNDNKNMVFFDKGWMGSSTLGVCYSWYSGCYIMGGMNWYVAGLDIVFKKTVNWEYGPNAPAGGKTDFESVALHELGHGHQLGHVINTNNVMHYAIGPNTSRRVLQTNDTACGNFVMQKSTSAVCSRPVMKLISQGSCIFVPLAADFTIDKSNVCTQDTVVFTDLSQGNIISWNWNFGLGATPATATGEGPHKVIYTIGGNKKVNLTINSGSSSDFKEYNSMISVKSTAQPIANFNSNFVAGCEIAFSVPNPLGTTTYTWDFDGQGTATGDNTSFSFTNNGPVDVKLLASNSCNVDSITKEINFICTDFIPNLASACISDTVTFTNNSGAATTLSWNFGDNAVPATALGTGPHQVVYSTGGTKNISLTTSDNNSNQTVSKSIAIKNANHAISSFTYEHQGNFAIQFTNNSTGMSNIYAWNFGDGNTSTETNPLHTYSVNPNGLKVTLNAQNVCDTSEYEVTLPQFSSVSSLLNPSQWIIFPNPSKDKLNIKSENNTLIEKIIITDMLGKQIFIEALQIPITSHVIDVSAFGFGIYTICIYSKNGVFNQQFTKQ